MEPLSELAKRFSYHPPKDGQPELYEDIRNLGYDFANFINHHVPDSREKSLALTKLEEVVMWANAGIARRS